MCKTKWFATLMVLGVLSSSRAFAEEPHWIYLQPSANLERGPLEALGARVRVVSSWLHAISLTADSSTMERIAALPTVRRIAPVGRGHGPRTRPGTRPPRWLWAGSYGKAEAQLKQLGVPALHACGLSGQGVTIGVLDTGFSLQHKAFADIDVKAAHDFVNDDDTVENETGDPSGQHNHGTLVLGLLAGKEAGSFSGVAPDASYLLAKVDNLTADTPIEDDWWVAGLEWAAKLGAKVVSSSISFCTAPCKSDTMDGATEATSKAAALAAEKGVVLLNSAGNTGPKAGSIRAPGDARNVLAIGGVSNAGKVAGDSARGPTADGRVKPDLVGPGVGVVSVDPGSKSAYRSYNGTSVATPLVAGVAALVAQAHPTKTALELINLLKSSGDRAHAPDSSHGWGLPQPQPIVAQRCQDRLDAGNLPADAGQGRDGATDTQPASDTGAPSGDTTAADGGGGCTMGASAPLGSMLLLPMWLLLRRRPRARPRDTSLIEG